MIVWHVHFSNNKMNVIGLFSYCGYFLPLNTLKNITESFYKCSRCTIIFQNKNNSQGFFSNINF